MNRLMPRTPLQPATTDLFEEFDRLRSHLLETFSTASAQRTSGWLPALGDLEEKDDVFIVNVEVPGFDRDDINIEMEGRRLIVHAEREEEEREGTVRSSTRSSAHLHHEVILPSDVNVDAIEATLDRGVLTIRVPKAEQSGRHRIEIT